MQQRFSQTTQHLTEINKLFIVRPSNRLEALTHGRAGQWSIRINDQWRVCFRFKNGDAFDVEILDYH
ncbi:MAG: type II toxin-antitoxin system RelE/ParE family toxin [Pseudomonadota bacterium]